MWGRDNTGIGFFLIKSFHRYPELSGVLRRISQKYLPPLASENHLQLLLILHFTGDYMPMQIITKTQETLAESEVHISSLGSDYTLPPSNTLKGATRSLRPNWLVRGFGPEQHVPTTPLSR